MITTIIFEEHLTLELFHALLHIADLPHAKPEALPNGRWSIDVYASVEELTSATADERFAAAN